MNNYQVFGSIFVEKLAHIIRSVSCSLISEMCSRSDLLREVRVYLSSISGDWLHA